jgi:hypothetical protein
MRGRLGTGAGAGAALLAWAAFTLPATGCAPLPQTDWTCDFDASENRPLSDPDATAGPDGSLSGVVCQTTCGPPVHSCTFTVLDGGVPGAICPVCTF